MKKVMTTQQAEVSKAKGVNFLRNVIGDDDHADDLEDESLSEWAERKGVRIIENPKRKGAKIMATKQQLEDRVAELEAELDEYTDRENRILDALGVELDDEDSDEETDDE